MRILPTAALFALAGLIPQDAVAQSRAGSFHVIPRAGMINYDRASSINRSGFLSVETAYGLTNMFSLGVNLLASRPSTRGEDFVHSLTYGDTTYLYKVTQPLNVLDIGGTATAQMDIGRLSPYLTGGVGAYRIFLDPQVSNGSKSFSRMSMTFGGGFLMNFGGQTAIMLDVRDVIFTDFRRDRLGRVTSSSMKFAEDLDIPPAAKSTLHNLALSIGFSFTPGVGPESGDGR